MRALLKGWTQENFKRCFWHILHAISDHLRALTKLGGRKRF